MLYSYITSSPFCYYLICSVCSQNLYTFGSGCRPGVPCSDIYFLSGIRSSTSSWYPWNNNATPEHVQGTSCVIVSTVISLILMHWTACGLGSARLRHMSSSAKIYLSPVIPSQSLLAAEGSPIKRGSLKEDRELFPAFQRILHQLRPFIHTLMPKHWAS